MLELELKLDLEFKMELEAVPISGVLLLPAVLCCWLDAREKREACHV